MKTEQYLGYLKRLTWLPLLMLGGCKMTLLDPKGQVGVDEKSLIITATLLMLIVVIPVIVMTLAFAWKYRASNTKGTYKPNWAHSTPIELVVWLVPCAIVAVLGTITWTTTHELDPYRPLDSDVKPIVIQAVSLDWKWLFIYPEQGIATVNEIAFPTDTPVSFQITSQNAMNSFFIPQLGSQIYSMAGMQTKLHLIANHEGSFDGLSANFSGDGFSDMKFKAIATSQKGFDAWVSKVKAAPTQLDQNNYPQLVKPSEKAPVQYFAAVSPTLYHSILMQYMHGPSTLLDGNQAEAGMNSKQPMQMPMNASIKE